jgi:hypothetical protein
MTTDQFFFWLQGHFELQSEPANITDAQAEIIDRHIDLAQQTIALAKTNPDDVPSWYAMLAIRAFVRLVPYDREHATAQIRAIVSAEFEHVIDPSFGPKNHEALNAVHSGGNRPTGKRC